VASSLRFEPIKEVRYSRLESINPMTHEISEFTVAAWSSKAHPEAYPAGHKGIYATPPQTKMPELDLAADAEYVAMCL